MRPCPLTASTFADRQSDTTYYQTRCLLTVFLSTISPNRRTKQGRKATEVGEVVALAVDEVGLEEVVVAEETVTFKLPASLQAEVAR